jgi:hypothetical protein
VIAGSRTVQSPTIVTTPAFLKAARTLSRSIEVLSLTLQVTHQSAVNHTNTGLPEARGQTYRLPGGAFFAVHDGKITSLKRFKDDAREVAQGFECGIGLDNYTDFRAGDKIVVEGKQNLRPNGVIRETSGAGK